MKAKVIMLPTEDKTNVGLVIKEWDEMPENIEHELGTLEIVFPLHVNQKYYKCQHLYLIDPNAEIKEDDWCFNNNDPTGRVVQANKSNLSSIQEWWNKIIATTDKLPLEPYQGHYKDVDCTNYIPQLSEQSINLLVDYYNKNGKMPDEVEVDTRYFHGNGYYDESELDGSQKELYSLMKEIKLNHQGEVDITVPEERTYTRKEVRGLIIDMYVKLIPEGYSKKLIQWLKDKNL